MDARYQKRDELRELIRREGLAVAEAARRAGLSFGGLEGVLNERSAGSPETWRRLRRTLGREESR